MRSEQVNLPEHEAEFIREAIASGRFANASEVVRAGLQLLEAREAENAEKLERLRAELQKGMDDIENGRYVELTGPEEIRAHYAELRKQFREEFERSNAPSASAE
jgi:antitoxin ParD1/3/4